MTDLPSTRVPVTLVTGFLGSGKTTLVQHILRNANKKVAVIQNEFADEMGIESQVLVDADGNVVSDFYELPNGCVCCSVRDDLVATIDALLDRDSSFKHILVETTGVADPVKLANIFWVDAGCGTNVYLDGIVTVVDGINIESHLRDTREGHGTLGLAEEAQKQISCADRLLLNKVDLLTAEGLERVETMLAELAPTAKIFRTQKCQIEMEAILSLDSFGANARAIAEETALNQHDDDHGHHHHHHDHHHDHHHEHSPHENHSQPAHHSVEHLVVRAEGILCPSKVEQWIGSVLWEQTSGFVYRLKGLFNGEDEDGPRVFVVQGVGDLFEVVPAEVVGDDALPSFLFIGKGLNKSLLRAELAQCIIG